MTLQKFRGPQLFEAPVETKVLDVSEKLFIKGEEVTATAEELNNASNNGTTASEAMVPVVQADTTAEARALLEAAAEADLEAKADLSAAQTFEGAQRSSTTVLTSASASVAIDMALNNDFSLTMTENTTLANPTNLVAGQKGRIVITQDAGTARTMAFGSYWTFAGGTDPTLSTDLGATDVLFYDVLSETKIAANLVKAFA